MTRLAAFCLAAGLLPAQTVSLTINTFTVVHSIDPKIYGQSLAKEGSGVWGEVVSNRSFEETLSEGEWKVNGGVLEAAGDARLQFGAEAWRDYELTVDVMRPSGNGVTVVGVPVDQEMENGHWYKVSTPVETWLALLAVSGGPARFAHIRVTAADGTLLFSGLPTPARDWFAVGAGEIAWNSEAAFHGERSVRMVARDADSGIEQRGIAVRAGDALRGSLWLNGSGPGLIVRLLDGDKVLAEQTVSAPRTEWREFPLLLNPSATSGAATLRILARAGSVVKVDQVSLMPDSYRANGGFRTDVTQAIAALRPPILLWTAGNWREAIGPQTKRARAFGVDEFLAFARKVGAEPVIEVPDAVGLLAYCNAARETYRVKYWKVYDATAIPAMKKIDPGIRIIAGLDAPQLADYFSILFRREMARPANSKAKFFVYGWNPPTAVAAGSVLHAMERDAAVGMAASAPGAWMPSPAYAVMKLYRDHFASDLLTLGGNLAGLDAVATRSANGEKIYLKLVNPANQEVAVEAALRGDFPLLDAGMRIVEANATQAAPGEIARAGMTVRFRVPRRSVAVVTLSR